MKNDWTLNTPIKWKRKKDIANLVFLVSEWCKNNLSYKSEMPIVWVDWNKSDIYGEYEIDDNEIIVYSRVHEKIEDLIDTTIHEWAHFLQDKKRLLRSLKTYKFSNDLNPNEIEAIKVAEENISKCWEDIRNNRVKLS